ncbi:helix-turn-helix domain-containing protein [Thermomonospora curvata]|uniref:Transcriptional regulator, XRE family n=1 Tax=Thermomonospora curvata (strain ATCC 19995 / DSM 43183 / JCM 3096 / KCTC 9072 / NBRC 15933 / NCIMB 10081 / Henssen B9) TaxID=471852 RepID=D1AF70_THECD|nr:helix-turn-helix transcriptional regulator [Thermomonospora curvata]ACY99614.1 transcriptional regulator, XRE family [Thermomonospora curvata DSM 43183]
MRVGQPPDPKSNLWNFIAFYLRFLRNQRGLSLEAMGRIMGCSRSSVSRIELGETRLDTKQAILIDRAWDIGGLFQTLMWYASIGHDPSWFSQYLDKERKAGVIKTYEANVIPGLFQTEDYARALLSTGDVPNTEEVLQRRIGRQEILEREVPPFVSAILNQNALEWPVGSPEIMRRQLARVLELSERKRIVVRVVPRTWDVGAFPGLDGSFLLMAGDDFGEVAYSESPGCGRLVSAPSDVQSYVIRWNQISAKALPETPSRKLIEKAMESFE